MMRILSDYCTSCEFFLCLCLPLHHGTGESITTVVLTTRRSGTCDMESHPLIMSGSADWRPMYSTAAHIILIVICLSYLRTLDHQKYVLDTRRKPHPLAERTETISEGSPFDLEGIPSAMRWEDASVQ